MGCCGSTTGKTPPRARGPPPAPAPAHGGAGRGGAGAPPPRTGQRPAPAPSPTHSPGRRPRTQPSGLEMLNAAAGRAKAAARRVSDEWTGTGDDRRLVRVGEYEVDKVIATGAQATVAQVHDVRDPAKRQCVKCYSLEEMQLEMEQDGSMEHEIAWYEFEMLRTLGQATPAGRAAPVIPRVHEAVQSDTHVYLVMDLIEGPTLRQCTLDPRRWRRRRCVAFKVTLPEGGELGLTCRGVTVTSVDPSGPAAAARRVADGRWGSEGADGIASDMRLCAINGVDVQAGDDLSSRLSAAAAAGGDVELVVSELEPADADAPERTYDAREVFTDLVEAVRFMHDNGVAHRDLKPENIVLDCSSGPVVARIVDFGCGAQVATAMPTRTMSSLHREVTGKEEGTRARRQPSVVLSRPQGTGPYLAPEVIDTLDDITRVAERETAATGADVGQLDVCGTELQTKHYRGRPYDIWSCGVILYEMFFNQLLFPGGEGAKGWKGVDESLGTPRMMRFDRLEPSAKDLLRKVLQPEADDRPSALEILRHPWLRGPRMDEEAV
eukprot:TRINITY_DN46986_c0_g1_i1.p1 TRINITY_DN46986_c0_g1~~TRINITY_DN46986_c0_g1_i1.p1  ORF type:complete len:582 (+),score=146.20 TRINITY_DN46986_c0_g1_i1:97-1746(+)